MVGDEDNDDDEHGDVRSDTDAGRNLRQVKRSLQLAGLTASTRLGVDNANDDDDDGDHGAPFAMTQ